MDKNDFEGTIILETLAECGHLDEFYDAIDADNFGKAKALMEAADIDSETITTVLQKMQEADGEH